MGLDGRNARTQTRVHGDLPELEEKEVSRRPEAAPIEASIHPQGVVRCSMTQAETFGAALAVVASVISNLGVNIQKYSHARDSELPNDDQRPYVQRPLWWLGLTLVIVGSIGDFTAFGFATQSLVAALGGGATLVANVFTAYFLNKEALYMTDLCGVLFVIIGVVLIAYIAAPNVDYPLPELEQRFVRKEFVIYIVVVGVLTVSMLATIKGSVANRLKNQMKSSSNKQKQHLKQLESRVQHLEHRMFSMESAFKSSEARINRADHDDGPLSPLLSDFAHHEGAGQGSNGIRASSASTASKRRVRGPDSVQPEWPLLDGVTNNPARVPYYYAICSGIIGSISVLLAKCSAVMIRLSLRGENQFRYPLTYVFLGGMVVCIVIQTHFLNLATALGDIMTVFPMFQACWITFSVVGGAVFYWAEDSVTPEEYVLYPAALLSIAIGVWFLVQHTSTADLTANEDEAMLRTHKLEAGGKQDNTPPPPGGAMNKRQKKKYDEETLVGITDASMRSPLLTEGAEVDGSGYLHLDP